MRSLGTFQSFHIAEKFLKKFLSIDFQTEILIILRLYGIIRRKVSIRN